MDCRGRVVTITIPFNTAGKNDEAHWAPSYLTGFESRGHISTFGERALGKSENQSYLPPPRLVAEKRRTAELVAVEFRPGMWA